MMSSRREFLAGVAGVSLGTVISEGELFAEDHRDAGGTGKPPQNKPSTSMVLETVFTDGLAQLSYLIGDRATGKAAVIDPRRDVEVYVELARKHKLTITHAIETHIHADFASGCRELADRTGTSQVYLSAEGGAEYGYPMRTT